MAWKRFMWNLAKVICVFLLEQLFKAVDADESGEISRDEIAEFVDSARGKLTAMKRRA